MSTVPFAQYTTDIKPEWIDYNKHLNDAYYAIVLSAANELFCDHLGLSADYRNETGAALYTVDLHIEYLAEVKSDDEIRAESIITELGTKKIRMRTELIRRDGSIAAVGTVLYLHFDSNVKAVTPLPDSKFSAAQQWLVTE